MFYPRKSYSDGGFLTSNLITKEYKQNFLFNLKKYFLLNMPLEWPRKMTSEFNKNNSKKTILSI
jgi:hypothetical protein